MVDYSGMFRPDPSIKRGRRFADTFTQASLKPIAPPQGTNVYGFSPLAEAGNRLASILGAQMLESSAESREQEQMAARGQVLAQLLKAGSARTPAEGFFTQYAPGEEPPGTLPSFVVNEQGKQVIAPLSDEIKTTSGLDPASYQIALQIARLQGDTATEAALQKEALIGMRTAMSQGDTVTASQYASIVDPGGRLKQAESLEKERLDRTDKRRKAAAKGAFKTFVVDETVTIDGQTYEPGTAYTLPLSTLNSGSYKEVLGSGAARIVDTPKMEEQVGPTIIDNYNRGIGTGGTPANVEGEPTEPIGRPPERTGSTTRTLKETLESPILTERLLERSSNTFFNDFSRVTNSVKEYFGLQPFSKEVIEASADLEAMTILLSAPLIKAIAARGGEFAIKRINRIMPNTDESVATNALRMKKLIPIYERELESLNSILKNVDRDSKQYSDATAAAILIMGTLPKLKTLVKGFEAGSSFSGGPTSGIVKIPDGNVTFRKVLKSFSPQVPISE